MTGRELRPYQREAVAAVHTVWAAPGDKVNPVVVLPTGTGKSTVIAELAVDARRRGMRVLMLAHRGELLQQMADSVAAVDPGGAPVGIVQAGRSEDTEAIVAASFQTLAASPYRLEALLPRHVILVDECHHAAAATYLDVLDRLGSLDPHGSHPAGPYVFTCGFTATAYRADGGLGKVWGTVAYEKTLVWALKQGYLITPRGLTVVTEDVDLTEVTVRSGDYAAGELETAMMASVETTVEAIQTHAADRSMIVFAAGVDHAVALADALTEHGIPAAAVTGSMSTEERENVYTSFRVGAIAAMVTVQVLTEGADFPRCDCVVMARPTRSQVLYTQMVGRAVRPYPGKVDALVLDLAGTVRDMSLVSLTDLSPEAETSRVSPTSEEDPGQEEPEPKPERIQRIGTADLEDIDLLATSPALWLTTKAGVKFLDAGNGTLVFLWPPGATEDTPVQVGVLGRGNHNGFHGDPMDLEAAVDHAVEVAASVGDVPNRNAPWRHKGKPSAAQVAYATGLGIPDADRKTRARLSDDISVHKASTRIDPYITR